MQEIHISQVTLDNRPIRLNSQRPRIAYLLSQYPAISHTFFLKEILGLKQLGFQVETASINPPDRPPHLLPAAEKLEASGTHYIKTVGSGKILRTIASLLFCDTRACLRGLGAALRLARWDIRDGLYALFYLGEALLLGKWMQKRDLHHLHIHFGGPVATVGMLASLAWDFSYSLTIHGPEEFYDVEQFYLSQKVQHASFIFCISNFCRSQLMKCAHPSHWDKLQVLRLGVDPEEFTPVSPSPRDTIRIVSVGRLVPAKGQLILLQAFYKLFHQGRRIQLTFVGDGPDREHLQQFVDKYDLAEHVIFCGALNHEQTRKQLMMADIFALASFAEGVPIALMEAMAMEIPCVSTSIAGIPELIRHNLDGLLVPASSVEILAAAIDQLVTDGELRRRLGASARARVIDCYNLPRNLHLLASAFEECLSQRTMQNL
jgi:colanic acid/amylovoran biosynthesis glycosyltransferase